MNSPPIHQSPPLSSADLLRLGGLAVLAAAVIAPVRHYTGPMKKVNRAKIDEDSFPLSTFPMFSEDRKGRVIVPHVVGLTADDRRILPHYSHYGAGGLNQVRKQIARDVREGRAVVVAQRYADSLAAPRRRNGSTETGTVRMREYEDTIVRLEVVRSRFVFDEYFAGSTVPDSETVFARCEVGGAAEEGPGGRLRRLRMGA